MSTSVLKALPGKLDIERHSPSNLYLIELAQTILILIPLSRDEGSHVSVLIKHKPESSLLTYTNKDLDENSGENVDLYVQCVGIKCV